MSCIYCNSEKESLTFSVGEYKVIYCPECFNYENDHYKHRTNEPLFDLVSVCHNCHELITKLDRNI
jgi:NAD-dependent SIR2 family protein deacetylase